jgi:hypothetical protein
MDDKCHAIYFLNLLKQGYAANPLLTSQVQVNKWVRSNYVTPITSAKEKPPSYPCGVSDRQAASPALSATAKESRGQKNTHSAHLPCFENQWITKDRQTTAKQ